MCTARQLNAAAVALWLAGLMLARAVSSPCVVCPRLRAGVVCALAGCSGGAAGHPFPAHQAVPGRSGSPSKLVAVVVRLAWTAARQPAPWCDSLAGVPYLLAVQVVRETYDLRDVAKGRVQLELQWLPAFGAS